MNYEITYHIISWGDYSFLSTERSDYSRSRKGKICVSTNQAGDYPGFCTDSPLDSMLVYHSATPSIKLAGTYKYMGGERVAVRG